MKEYGSIPRFFDDGTLRGEQVVAFNKLDGQNLSKLNTVKKLVFLIFYLYLCSTFLYNKLNF